jgi:hypothetical protein
MIQRSTYWCGCLLATLGLTAIQPARGQAQVPDAPSPDWFDRESALPRYLDAAGDSSVTREHRIRLFRISPGFLADPVGLDSDDSSPSAGPQADPGPDWVSLTMGADNPFFDFRRPGDPGGVGYYRVNTQMLLLDSGYTGCSLALQAVTPAGRESDGLQDGQTVLIPQVALFHDLGDGTALQGFFGKNVNLNSPNYRLHHSLEYGVAVQRPLVTDLLDAPGDFYFFVEALGRYRYDSTTSATPSVWEVLPGVQWRLNDNWWVSGGVIVPVKTASSSDPRLWQVTCKLQF